MLGSSSTTEPACCLAPLRLGEDICPAASRGLEIPLVSLVPRCPHLCWPPMLSTTLARLEPRLVKGAAPTTCRLSNAK